MVKWDFLPGVVVYLCRWLPAAALPFAFTSFPMMRSLFLVLLLSLLPRLQAQERYQTFENRPYYPEAARQADAYLAEQCVLDLYVPLGVEGFSTVVWFHGGGLTGGDKYIPEGLRGQGVAVAAVKYRLSPQVKSPVWIEDAAAAVAWVLDSIAAWGGDPERVFVSGHSAGGYLASMVGLDRRWLAASGHSADALAGLIPFSGHAITHFTIRAERDIPARRPWWMNLPPCITCGPMRRPCC